VIPKLRKLLYLILGSIALILGALFLAIAVLGRGLELANRVGMIGFFGWVMFLGFQGIKSAIHPSKDSN
jgi:hypothetical protein